MSLSPSGIAFAFAFDIDGVLVNGKTTIPGAQETLIRLQKHGIPFIFPTNSGGVTEKANVDKLALRLGNITFEELPMVQSHTPFHDLVDEYKDKTVLVLGEVGDNIRDVAAAYGFQDVVTSWDLLVDNEYVHPFPEMTREHHTQHGHKASKDQERHISAIMCWSSPRDWCLDLQIVLDLLLSEKGILNTRSKCNGDPALPNRGYQVDGQPKLFFCNGDFVWSTSNALSRLAQGAFLQALKGIWSHATDCAELLYCICGIKTVYMIGDNPASDIAGANGYTSECGYDWRSILVETGVYEARTKPEVTPTHIARNVAEAVDWAVSATVKETLGEIQAKLTEWSDCGRT